VPSLWVGACGGSTRSILAAAALRAVELDGARAVTAVASLYRLHACDCIPAAAALRAVGLNGVRASLRLLVVPLPALTAAAVLYRALRRVRVRRYTVATSAPRVSCLHFHKRQPHAQRSVDGTSAASTGRAAACLRPCNISLLAAAASCALAWPMSVEGRTPLPAGVPAAESSCALA